jgi:predicted nucleic acid-binding protein
MKQFNVLKRLFGKIFISQDVFKEVVISGTGRPGCEEIRKAEWIKRRKVSKRNQIKKISRQANLSYGEATINYYCFIQ